MDKGEYDRAYLMDWLGNIVSWDKELLLLINGSGVEWADGWMWLVSSKWIWLGLYISMLGVLGYRMKVEGERGYADWRGRWWLRWLVVVMLIVLVVGLSDFVSSGLVKGWVCRYRPTHDAGLEGLVRIVNGYRGGKYGFVSSHAANCFSCGLLFCLIWCEWKTWLSMMLWVGLNCWSRMYLGVHYPLDILGGLLLGGIFAVLGYVLVRRMGLLVGRERGRWEDWVVPMVFMGTLGVVMLCG